MFVGQAALASAGGIFWGTFAMLRSLPRLALPFLLLFAAANAYAENKPYRVQDFIEDGELNVRDGPGQGHEKTGVLSEGETGIEVLRCQKPDDKVSRHDWCLVKSQYNTGWISSCCIEPLQSTIAPNGEYPLVIDKPAVLNGLGISLGRELSHNCYYYGDGGYGLSVDDRLLDLYKAKGFSLRSLCMALVSGIRFDPVTGKRLATYVYISDPDALREAKRKKEEHESGVVTEELPLTLPSCFRNGTPYSDCVMNYDPISGQPLNAETTQKYRALGAKIERTLLEPARKDEFKQAYLREIREYGSPSRGQIHCARVSPEMYWHKVRFYDYSDDFPKEFGYALYADGGAAPDVSAGALKAALDDSKPRSQIDARRLRQLLSGTD